MTTSQEQEIYQLLKAKIGQLDLQTLLRPQFFQLVEQTKNSTDLALILYTNEVMSREDMEECIGESTTLYQNLEIYRVAKNKNAAMQLLEALYETGNFHILRLLHQSSLLDQPKCTNINQPWLPFKNISRGTPKGELPADSYQQLREKIRQVELRELLGANHIFELLEHTIDPIEFALIFFKKDVMSMQELKQCMNQSMILYQNLEVYRAVRAKNAGAPLIDALEQTGNFHILQLLESNLMAYTKERATNVSESTEIQVEDSQEQSYLQGSKAKTWQHDDFESKTWAKEAVDSIVKTYIQKMANLFEDPDLFYNPENLQAIHDELKAEAMTIIKSFYKQRHQEDRDDHLSLLEIQLLEAIAYQYKTVQEINRLRDSYFNTKARNALIEAKERYLGKMTGYFDFVQNFLYKGRDKELSIREMVAYEGAVKYLMDNIPKNLVSKPQVVQSLNEELTNSIKFWFRGQKADFYFREYGHIITFILALMYMAHFDDRDMRIVAIFLGIFSILFISLFLWLMMLLDVARQKPKILGYPTSAFVYAHEGRENEVSS